MSAEHVKRWRKATKARMVAAMGGKCQCCGYDRCHESLDFHHIDPNEKELPLGSIRANPRSWLQIVHELKKCILVCRNCHGEIHYGHRTLPIEYAKFDESFVEYKNHPALCDECPTCGSPKPAHHRYCSLSCAGRGTRIDWNQFNLEEMLKTMSVKEIARAVNLSRGGVLKRMKKLGLKSLPRSQRAERTYAPFVKPVKTPKPPRLKVSDTDPHWRTRPNLALRKVERPSKEELERLVWEKPFTEIGKQYGVRDNSIKKWCISYEISWPPRGYWRRREAGYSHEDALKSQARPLKGKRFITIEIAEEARRLRLTGMSYRDIGLKLGFGHWSVQGALRRYKIEPTKEEMAAQSGAAPLLGQEILTSDTAFD